MDSSMMVQLVRILMNAGGMYWFGDAVANGEMYQAAVGGVVAVVAFMWWMWSESKKA